MKKIWIVLAVLMVMVGCSAPAQKEEESKKTTIGVITWVTHPALDAAVEGMIESVNEQLGEDNVEIIVKNANEDESSAQLIVKDFVAKGVDIIYAVATPSLQAAYAVTMDNPIPIIFSAVTDPVAAGVVESMETPNTHVSGVSDAAPIEAQIALIKEILPEATKIGMLYTLSELNGKIQVDQASEIAKTIGIEVVIKGISQDSEIALAAQQLAQSTDAIYIITDSKIVTATAVVVNQANDAGIPVFAAEDGQMSQGLLASDSLSYLNMGKEAGTMIVDVLNGSDIKTLPVKAQGATQLYINQKVAEALNISLPQSVLDRAIILD